MKYNMKDYFLIYKFYLVILIMIFKIYKWEKTYIYINKFLLILIHKFIINKLMVLKMLNQLLKINIFNIKMDKYFNFKINNYKLVGIKDILILYLNHKIIIINLNYLMLMILIHKIENYLKYLIILIKEEYNKYQKKLYNICMI